MLTLLTQQSSFTKGSMPTTRIVLFNSPLNDTDGMGIIISPILQMRKPE